MKLGIFKYNIFAMNDIELQIQKHAVSFCSILPKHVNKWESVIQEADRPLKALGNFAEQLRHIEKANIKHMDNFSDIQSKLQFQILMCIEEEMKSLKEFIDVLNNTNHDLKNKISVLERSTISLDWEADSTLLRGCATQPSLSRLLQNGLEFWNFYSCAIKIINDNFRFLDIRNEQSVQNLENSFIIDFKDRRVTYLLAITQYVDNEKAIT